MMDEGERMRMDPGDRWLAARNGTTRALLLSGLSGACLVSMTLAIGPFLDLEYACDCQAGSRPPFQAALYSAYATADELGILVPLLILALAALLRILQAIFGRTLPPDGRRGPADPHTLRLAPLVAALWTAAATAAVVGWTTLALGLQPHPGARTAVARVLRLCLYDGTLLLVLLLPARLALRRARRHQEEAGKAP